MNPFFQPFLPLLATVATVHGAVVSWPGFRGANSSGVAVGANPPVQISPTNAVAWKVAVPMSPSSPTIWNDHLYLTTFAGGELQTRCYRREDGKLEWSRGIRSDQLESYHRTDSGPAASTPVTDGDHVVTYFGSFGLICHDPQGKELWRHPLPMALSLGGYGTGTSPLIAGRLVVVCRDQDDKSSLLAVDLRSGKTAWETPRPDSYGSFGTPVLWNNQGTDEIVVPGSLRLKGYALKTGVEDWMIQGVTAFACTTPVVGDGRLYFAAWSDGKADDPWPNWAEFLAKHDRNKDGVVQFEEFSEDIREYYRGLDVNRNNKVDQEDYKILLDSLAQGENVLIAVQPGGKGDITASHIAWKVTRGLPYVASPLLYEGRLYCIKNGGMISSFDATTGKAFYMQERMNAEGNYYSSPVAAAGRIYAASLNGRVSVIQAGGAKPEILHQADFGERILSSPAIAGDHFYLRTESALYSFGPAAKR